MNDTGTDSARILAPLWRRKWLILAVAILVAAGSYEYYKRKPKSFGAATQLYLGPSAEQPATGEPTAGISKRVLSNQVALINSPLIGEAVRKRLRSEHHRISLRGTAKATSKAGSDFVTIAAKARTPRAAVMLANDYAVAYIAREKLDYLSNVRNQIVSDRRQLGKLEESAVSKHGAASALQQATLANKLGQLESDISTFAAVQQVSPAKAEAVPIGPSPKKNAIFGFVVGLLLASIAAYALNRLDRRLRTLSELEHVFHSEILVALPSVGAPVIRPDGRRAPARPLLEPLRRLHTLLHLGLVSHSSNGSRTNGRTNGKTTLQLGPMLNGARQKGPRVIMFISSDAGDGKSTIIANLARVQSDAGARVAVIEADFRRPVQARLLDVHAAHGLADVLSGEVVLTTAMQSPAPSAPLEVSSQSGSQYGSGTNGSATNGSGTNGVATAVRSRLGGSLSVLVSGGDVQNPPALLASEAMSELLHQVGEEYDCVLVDVPPPLEVSDAMPLLRQVDGVVIVARLGHTRRVSAQRLAQLLGRTASAPVLGMVANCVPRKDIEAYGFAFAPVLAHRRPRMRIAR